MKLSQRELYNPIKLLIYNQYLSWIKIRFIKKIYLIILLIINLKLIIILYILKDFNNLFEELINMKIF